MFNNKPAHFFSYLRGKRIAVIGAGISNRPLIRWLWPHNENITVFDMMREDDPRLLAIQDDLRTSDCHPDWSVGVSYLNRLKGFDIIFRTPRMRPDLPELVRERNRGAYITSEISLFIHLCPAPIYAVTGSDGKTTVTTLISRMLESADYRVFTGGNIGTPLLDQVEYIDVTDRVVLELSSFQLMDMTPRVRCALITNVTPNHLDFHRDFREYIDAKKNIFLNQSPTERLILNAQDPISSSFISEAKGVYIFSTQARVMIRCQLGNPMAPLARPDEATGILCQNKDLQYWSFQSLEHSIGSACRYGRRSNRIDPHGSSNIYRSPSSPRTDPRIGRRSLVQQFHRQLPYPHYTYTRSNARTGCSSCPHHGRTG